MQAPITPVPKVFITTLSAGLLVPAIYQTAATGLLLYFPPTTSTVSAKGRITLLATVLTVPAALHPITRLIATFFGFSPIKLPQAVKRTGIFFTTLNTILAVYYVAVTSGEEEVRGGARIGLGGALAIALWVLSQASSTWWFWGGWEGVLRAFVRGEERIKSGEHVAPHGVALVKHFGSLLFGQSPLDNANHENNCRASFEPILHFLEPLALTDFVYSPSSLRLAFHFAKVLIIRPFTGGECLPPHIYVVADSPANRQSQHANQCVLSALVTRLGPRLRRLLIFLSPWPKAAPRHPLLHIPIRQLPLLSHLSSAITPCPLCPRPSQILSFRTSPTYLIPGLSIDLLLFTRRCT